MTTLPRRFIFEFTGGALCLEFANTVDRRPDQGQRKDHLTSCADFLSWLVQSSSISSKEARHLLGKLNRSSGKADSFFRRVIALREAIYRIFSAVAGSRRPAGHDLDSLNSVVSEMMARMRVVSEEGGFAWKWMAEGKSLDGVLWPIAKSAADLLTSDRLRSVRECAAEDCGWLFIDNSANQRRRWCDMKVCGNRAKARRHYQRSRKMTARRTVLQHDSHAPPME
jgi:predicted RNA-binding Zn ribbon-like protein